MKKYRVTQYFIDELKEWRKKWERDEISVNAYSYLPQIDVIERWRFMCLDIAETQKRYGAIVNWINGEDVFEIGQPQYIVQRKRNKALGKSDEYISFNSNGDTFIVKNEKNATRFISFEKASEWSNKHFEVVEVDE